MSQNTLPIEWKELISSLPGYDPFRACGECWFDPALAEHAIGFIETHIRHIEGALAGKLFLLQMWQKALVANLFGWQRIDAHGRQVRRYRECLLYVPRKNGKTPLVAAIALYVLFCDKEKGQQNYVAAAEKDQAGLLFRQAKGMVEQEQMMLKRCQMYGGNAQAGQSRSIVREKDGSYIRVVSADANTKHGGNPHLVMVDELHAQPNRDLVDVLQTSMASQNRKQSLMVYLTTADFDRESICNEKHDYACKVRDGIIDDPSFLPVIYEAKPEDDWTSPEVWAKANPNLGVSVSLEYLHRECKHAQETPAYENTFRRLHLNQRTKTDTRFVPMDKWDACAGGMDVEDLLGQACWAGLDMSTTTDLTALVLLFLREEEFVPLPFFWAPAEKARERSRRDRVPYELWAQQGYITLTEGSVVDYDRVRVDILAISERYQITDVAADRWNATQLITQLTGAGLNVVAFGQGFASMTAPTKRLLDLVLEGRIRHGANPVLRWMASVMATEQDAAGNLKPSKRKSTDRIDGMVSLIMALGRAMVTEEVSAGGCEFW